MYRLTYWQGNGYHCSCCRSTSTHTEEFQTEEELIDFIIEFEYNRKHPEEYTDDDDGRIEDIVELKEEDLLEKFTKHPKVLDGIAAKEEENKKIVYLYPENTKKHKLLKDGNAI